MDKDVKNAVKNTIFVLQIIGIAIMFAIIHDVLAPLNSEEFIQNYSLGLLFTMIFCMLYIVPFDTMLFNQKKLWRFLILFWLGWFLADYGDFIIAVLELYM